jgi:ribosomal protein S4
MKNKYKSLKYKTLLHLRENFQDNSRILKFKRPKWNLLKKTFFFQFIAKKKKTKTSENSVKKLPYYEQSGYHISPRWVRLRFNYKESLLSKLRLYYFYTLKTRVHSLKRQFLNLNSIEEFLLNIESRIDVVLWRAGFFKTPAIARFHINHKNVYINDKLVNLSNLSLKGGDIINISERLLMLVQSRYNKIRSSRIQNNITNGFLRKKYKGQNYKKYKKFFKKWDLIRQSAYNDTGPRFIFPFFLEINWDLLNIIFIRQYKKEDLNKLSYIYNTNLNLPALRNYLWRL